MTTLYLSGPMSGWENYNYPLFHEVAAILREAGYAVVNPAETPAPEGETPDWQWWMRRAITAMMTADAVAVLPAWGTSRGARTEVELALNLGMEVATLGEWTIRADIPPKALSDAARRLHAAHGTHTESPEVTR